jgi:hypothetical protein
VSAPRSEYENSEKRPTDNEEHPKRRLGVLDLGQEIWREAEGKRDLGGLVEVGFEDVTEGMLVVGFIEQIRGDGRRK